MATAKASGGSITPTQKWYAIVGAVALAIFAAGFMLFVHPRMSQAGNTNAQADTVQTQIGAAATKLSLLTQKAAQLPAEEKIAAKIAQRFPNTADQNNLLTQINAAAAAAGLNPTEISGLTLGVPTVVTQAAVGGVSLPSAAESPTPGAPTASAAPTVVAPVTVGQIASMTVALNIAATPAVTIKFLHAMENGTRAFLIGTLSTGGGSAAAAGGTASNTTTISGTMFIVPAPVAPVAPGAVVKPGSTGPVAPVVAGPVASAPTVSAAQAAPTHPVAEPGLPMTEIVGGVVLIAAMIGGLVWKRKQDAKA